MSRKSIQFKLGNNLYQIDAWDVADARAIYYADSDVKQNPATDWLEVYTSEVEAALKDDYELIDYLRGSLDFDFVEPRMKLIKTLSGATLKEMFDELMREGDGFEVKDVQS